jgi:PAS domain S-box-containing protein
MECFTMPLLIRRSLLVQLVSVYLLFVLAVLFVGVGVNAAIEQRLRHDVEVSDQALAQEIALETTSTLGGVDTTLGSPSAQGVGAAIVTLGALAQRASASGTLASAFQAFMAGRHDVEHVYWLDPVGTVLLSVKSPTSPPDSIGLQTEFSPPGVIQRALKATAPVFEVGIAQETQGSAGVIVAEPVQETATGKLMGIVVLSLSLEELSAPLRSVVDAQAQQNHHLLITIIDDQGVVVASSQEGRILRTALNELPGARDALAGYPVSGPDGSDWLFSAVPVAGLGWAVVVQRPSDEALDVVTQLHLWLLAAAAIFAVGVAVFWLLLMRRVIRPLHALAFLHQTAPTTLPALAAAPRLSDRKDEVGALAKALERLEQDVYAKLSELHTLLETSNAVVGSLDPRTVVSTIIREARRLVDVQAAAVLVPDEQGALQVLVSEGHTLRYEQALSLPPQSMTSAAVAALRDRTPVQKVLDPTLPEPSLSSEEGFRAVLAIPIISRHAGGVVLLVHRAEARLFSAGEIDLLLTFANYATLAWEHAKLYERSDERLQVVAAENERLYRLTFEEKQRLEATMGSMRDGLVLAGADGRILYANRTAALFIGQTVSAITSGSLDVALAALQAASTDAQHYNEAVKRDETGERPTWTIETHAGGRRRVVELHLFAVRGDDTAPVGRGLLLRDVTLERETDEFKTTLLAAVGHEVRTPLAAIKGHASTLLQDDVTWSAEEQQHSLRTISAEADRLSDLVRDLLDFSRQQAGMLPLHRQPWRLDDLLAGALQRLRSAPPHLEIDLPDDLPLLEVDRARIEVVLTNLLANAVAYGGEHVRVIARALEGRVILSVSDDGQAIEPSELSHLFERFYRAGHGMQRRSQGTGLGLAICKAFVEAHGGTISAESGPQGTTICVILPATHHAQT